MKANDIPREKMLKDGIYNVAGIPFLHIDEGLDDLDRLDKFDEQVVKFIADHPDYVVGSAYQCPATFFLGWCPKKASEDHNFRHIGSGFSYGSTNLLANCPNSLLILAEDD